MPANVELGIVLQTPSDPGGQARRYEALGYDYVAAGEHVSFNVPVANAFISLAVAAGATSSIKLMSTITLVPLYPAALLAKLGASLDVASGGRFSMGVGVGGEFAREFAACGIPVNERGARTNEALDIVTRLWTEQKVDFEGRFNRFAGVSIEPRPTQNPHPPIWISGRRDAAMRRAARYGTGWLPYMYTPEMVAESLITIRGLTDRPVRGGVFMWGCVHHDDATAKEMAASVLGKVYAQDFSKMIGRYAFAGNPETVIEQLGRYLDAGATTIIASFAAPNSHLAECERLFSAEVLPSLRARGG